MAHHTRHSILHRTTHISSKIPQKYTKLPGPKTQEENVRPAPTPQLVNSLTWSADSGIVDEEEESPDIYYEGHPPQASSSYHYASGSGYDNSCEISWVPL